MNGYITSGMAEAITAHGPVSLTHPDLTDLWGEPEHVYELLGHHPDHFKKEVQDRISAHIPTPNGRLFVHRIDTDQWEVPRYPADRVSIRATMRLLDGLVRILGVKALHYSPLARGVSLLSYSQQQFPERFKRDLPPEWEQRDTGITPNFTRRQTDWKVIGWTLHKYDVRMAWPAAARTTPMGFGQTIALREFNPRVPGLWAVKLHKPFPANPAPITVSGWYDTAIVRAAQHARQNITVGMGRSWAGAATCLRQWEERLIRARLRANNQWLVDAIKRVYTVTQGALDLYRPSRAWAYQPHWYYALRAESARRMWYALNNLDNPLACYLIGVDTDSLFALAPANIDPLAILPSARPDAFNPGTLRYEGSTPLTREMYDLLGGRGSELSALLRKRNCLEVHNAESF